MAIGHVTADTAIATAHDTIAALPVLMGTLPIVDPERPFTAM